MKKSLLAIALTAACAGSVWAQTNDTLAKIKGSGSVTLGVRESSGLGFTLGNGKYVGFHTEMGERVAADLQKQLGLTKLELKYQPVTSQNRIPLLQNGTIDIECGSTTNNAARQKDVAFAVTTYVEEVGIAVIPVGDQRVHEQDNVQPLVSDCCPGPSAQEAAAARSRGRSTGLPPPPAAGCVRPVCRIERRTWK